MVKKSKGYRRGTRKLLRKHPRKRGLAPLGRLLHEYSIADKVAIIIDPSVHKGQPHRRFHGKIGVVTEKRGRSYVISVRDGDKIKYLTVRPEHIRPHLGG